MRAVVLLAPLLVVACKKPTAKEPMIYLYPPESTEVVVRFADPSAVDLLAAYPDYDGGWDVLAEPDGTLTDDAGRAYRGLFWEGRVDAPLPEFDSGSVVARRDVEPFLERSLAALGLDPAESADFIVYWAPLLEEHGNVFVHFSTDDWADRVPLDVTPTPDSTIRLMMYWKPTRAGRAVPPQTFEAPERTGFTLVEWGGTRLR